MNFHTKPRGDQLNFKYLLAVTVVVNLSSNIVEHNYLLKQFKAYTKISGSSTVTKIGATLHLLIRTHYQRSR